MSAEVEVECPFQCFSAGICCSCKCADKRKCQAKKSTLKNVKSAMSESGCEHTVV